jgi:hypothetical protein
MSEVGTTKLAIGAVSRATFAATQMTAEDLRNAGGKEGLVASDVRSRAEFGQSKLGSGIAAMFGSVAGDEKKTEYLTNLFKEGKLTEKSLSEGMLDEIGQNLGKSSTEMNSIFQNRVLAKEALKDDKLSELFAGEGTDKTINATLFEGLERATGKTKEEHIAEFKEFMKKPGATLQKYKTSNIIDKFEDEDAQQAYEKYSPMLDQEFLESLDPDAKKRFEQNQQRMTQLDTDLAKKYAGANAPLVTQAIGAIAENREGTTEEMVAGVTKLFAMPGMGEGAQEAAQKIASLSGSKEFDKEAVGSINTIVNAQREKAKKQQNENLLSGKQTDYMTSQRANELGEVNEEEIDSAVDALKDNPLAKNAAAARKRLEELDKQEAEGTLEEGNKQSLEGLRTFKKLGLLDSEKAYGMAKKGGRGAVAAGVIQAEVDYQHTQRLDEFEKNADQGLGFELEEKAKQEELLGGGQSKTREALKSYGYNTKKLRQDFNKGEGLFKDQAYVEEFNKSGAGKLVNEATEKITHDKEAYQESQAAGGPSPEAQQQAALLKAINSLVGAITEGGEIGSALRGLSTALLGGT